MVCEYCNEEVKLRKTKDCRFTRACACTDLQDFEPATLATIIVPSKFPDIFADCKESLDKYAPKQIKVLVRDGNDIATPEGWTTIQGPAEKFVYSRNINLGIKESKGDVLLTNDDVRFTHYRTVEVMQAIMSKNPDIGILSPLVIGDVGEYWQSHATKTFQETKVRLCFVCVLIRQEVIEQVGLLDEKFVGYGGEDVDYCRRVVNAGWKIGVTAKARVIHGHGQDRRSASFNRNEMGTIDQLDKVAMDYYESKWGDRSLECEFDQLKNSSCNYNVKGGQCDPETCPAHHTK